MNDEQKFTQMIEGKDKHFSNKGFLNKVQQYGMKLGSKGLHAIATLYIALKSPNMPNANKLIIVGALGYFILPIDVVADFLPFVGLSDDVFIVTTALAKVILGIDDEMKQEAHQLLKKLFGERYTYNDEFTVTEIEQSLNNGE